MTEFYDPKSIIELGKEMEDLVSSKAGKFIIDSIDILISQTCADMAVGKIQKDKGKKKRGEWICTTLEEFNLLRGQYIGLEKVLDLIDGKIAEGKREQENQEEETKH